MKYYNLFVFEAGQWVTYFGDHERALVFAEMHELHHGWEGIPVAHMKIEAFDSDEQSAIDAAQDMLNATVYAEHRDLEPSHMTEARERATAKCDKNSATDKAFDRGGIDAYYGRMPKTGNMTPREVEAYMLGWDTEPYGTKDNGY